MAKRPTQQDVADLAGVSRASVSYVLSGDDSRRRRVSEATQQRVWDAAQRLGYQPNVLARGLRAGNSHSIGLLIPDMDNPYYLSIVQGAEEEALTRGYDLTVANAALDPERERRCLRSVLQRRLDGLIVLPTYEDVFTEEIARRAIGSSTLVFVGRWEGLDSVEPNTWCGAEALVQYILGLGHRRIGIIDGVAVRGGARDRVLTYLAAIHKAGLSIAPELVRHVGPNMNDGYEATLALLDLPEPPTAILAINDLLAIGALRGIQERGLRVPQDISIAGFDNIQISAYLYPPLTTVDMHGHEIGRRAAQLVFERLCCRAVASKQEQVRSDLLIRASTASVPVPFR